MKPGLAETDETNKVKSAYSYWKHSYIENKAIWANRRNIENKPHTMI